MRAAPLLLALFLSVAVLAELSLGGAVDKQLSPHDAAHEKKHATPKQQQAAAAAEAAAAAGGHKSAGLTALYSSKATGSEPHHAEVDAGLLDPIDAVNDHNLLTSTGTAPSAGGEAFTVAAPLTQEQDGVAGRMEPERDDEAKGASAMAATNGNMAGSQQSSATARTKRSAVLAAADGGAGAHSWWLHSEAGSNAALRTAQSLHGHQSPPECGPHVPCPYDEDVTDGSGLQLADERNRAVIVPTSLCKFPFVYGTTEYYGCIYDHRPGSPSSSPAPLPGSPSGQPSAKTGERPFCYVREKDRVGFQRWAYCADDCPGAKRSCMSDTRGDRVLANQCVFPFRHEGVEYNSCITDERRQTANGTATPFCYSKLNPDGTGVEDSWGQCGECRCVRHKTTDGRECKETTTAVFKGGRNVTVHGCTSAGNRGGPWCTTVDGGWGFCERPSNCEVAATAYKHTKPDPAKVPSRIAFGSCYYRQAAGRDLELFKSVLRSKADLWLWLGDNIYADTHDTAKCGKMERAYRDLKEDPGYQSLLASRTPVMAVYDDHDFGQDNVGRHYWNKRNSVDRFLDFMDVPKDDPRRHKRGVYNSVKFSDGQRSVKVIMVDTRFHRRTVQLKDEHQCEGIKDALLGAEQWAWLEEEVRDTADVLFIASSVQVLSPLRDPPSWLCSMQPPFRNISLEAVELMGETGVIGSYQECWGEFPTERLRLLHMAQMALNTRRYRRIMFLSGDVHFGEILRKELKGRKDGENELQPVQLFELTATGIRIRWKPDSYNYNRLQVAADKRGDGIFDKSCSFPFSHDGLVYKNCTAALSPDKKTPACYYETDEFYTGVPGKWGHCAPEGTEIPKWNSRQGRIPKNEAMWTTDPYQVNNVVSNYGRIDIDWERREIALRIIAPHQKDEVAAETFVGF